MTHLADALLSLLVLLVWFLPLLLVVVFGTAAAGPRLLRAFGPRRGDLLDRPGETRA